ncbi:hypothetical protein Q9L58_008046, partial [Maublancomyces gigas]
MALHFSGHLSSETLEILAQSGEKKFFVHGDILAAQSEPLRKIVEGVQDGSTSQKIDLQEWDGDTVGRFVEFLYVGHYQAPSPTQPSSVGPGSTVSEDGAYQQGADTPTTSQSVRPGMSRSVSTETIQSNWTASPVGPRPLTPLWRFDLELQNHSDQNLERGRLEMLGLRSCDPAICGYGEVLLAHARVYSLAQNQKVEALQKLAYKRLLSTLLSVGSVEPGSQVVVDFIDLLRYVYSHTVSSGSSEEPLQNIVSQFAALNFPALQSRDEMTGLIREGGKLASDLMGKVCKRLVNSEDLLQSKSTSGTETEEAVKDTEQRDTEQRGTGQKGTGQRDTEQRDIKQKGTEKSMTEVDAAFLTL